jgi:hypothetical protein
MKQGFFREESDRIDKKINIPFRRCVETSALMQNEAREKIESWKKPTFYLI